MQKIIYTLQDLSKIVPHVLMKVPQRSVICFYGPMGSGKTTLIKGLIQQLGGVDQGSSPSFGIVNEYHYPDGELLGYHFDFYRINDAEEALDLGLEDYLNRDAWVFIEWPEKITELLPRERVEITLEVLSPDTRKLFLQP